MSPPQSYTSPIYTLLFFGNNFHLEHHIYPHVPCYRLPSVHKLLNQSGFLKDAGCLIDDSILGIGQYVFSKYEYPSGLEDAKNNFINSNMSYETYSGIKT